MAAFPLFEGAGHVCPTRMGAVLGRQEGEKGDILDKCRTNFKQRVVQSSLLYLRVTEYLHKEIIDLPAFLLALLSKNREARLRHRIITNSAACCLLPAVHLQASHVLR